MINGEDLPDDNLGFDYEQAVRDSIASPMREGRLWFFIFIEMRRDINSEISRLSIEESNEEIDFWQGAPPGWQHMENEELEEIGLVSGNHKFNFNV